MAWSLAASAIVPRILDGTLVPRSDHALFVVLAVGLGVVWARYRREPAPETKIRLAALAALAALVFLSVTAAMPWVAIDAGAGGGSIVCLLGQEASCAVRAGTPLLATASDPGAAVYAFEVQRWQCAAAALRMGQVTALSLLLPALIWLLVAPHNRAAQAASAVGASVAGFTLMVTLLYTGSVPAWLLAEHYWTTDIALLSTATIVVASVLIVRQSFALIAGGHGLPRAATFASPRRGSRCARDRASDPRS